MVKGAIENSVGPTVSALYMVAQMKYRLTPRDLDALEREIQKKVNQLEKDLQKELTNFCKKKTGQKRYTVRKRTR